MRIVELMVQGRRVRLSVVRDGAGLWIGWAGQSRRLLPVDASVPESAAVDREIRSPMAGRVVQVHVQNGTAVRARDPLVVLEAMKMEYRVAAPRDGVVESVSCVAGARVDLGEILVRLRP